ncbi:MAG: nucleotide exchange factor GrpE [Lachnospiraceae bacterium]|nr:nucleotide exchange factor GrpE [Lachnospiraceae bacterium]MBR6303436.1 nucleotide exchange factor GrpE [Lachnospiraceae bacterium]MBR6908895.1 nucleotide exchange factor GrpE [Lachnospiraceae bacterium]
MAEEEIKKEASQEAAEDTKETKAEEAKAEETKAEEAKTEEPSKKSKKEKPSKTDKEKEALKEQVSVLEDKVKRQLAEFENFRNRTEKEKTASYDNGAANALKKFLPVVDNFERGLASVPEDKKDDPFVQGMDKIYRQFVTELENIGVEPIEALGLPLDPNLHNAVTQQESDEYEPGTICAELQKGYTYHGIVLRYSMVAVVPE